MLILFLKFNFYNYLLESSFNEHYIFSSNLSIHAHKCSCAIHYATDQLFGSDFQQVNGLNVWVRFRWLVIRLQKMSGSEPIRDRVGTGLRGMWEERLRVV